MSGDAPRTAGSHARAAHHHPAPRGRPRARRGGRRRGRDVDWDSWGIDTATDDLAYMLALHWYPDWRRRYERDSLHRYHEALVAHGVSRYSFDALWLDYRYSVLWQITTPMWQANHALHPGIWWNHL